MTNRFDLRAGLCRALTHLTLALTLAAGLAACGPGTGGTGTGPITPTVGFSGNATGSLLAGSTAGGNVTTPPASGCTADCALASLRLDADRVELTAPCLRFVFTASWAVDAGGLAVLAGTLELARGTAIATSKAALRLQFSSTGIDSEQVSITLTNDAGNALLGPATLLRNDAAPGGWAPACGPT